MNIHLRIKLSIDLGRRVEPEASELVQDGTGTHLGFGFVETSHPVETPECAGGVR